jgi:hypothetical protein
MTRKAGSDSHVTSDVISQFPAGSREAFLSELPNPPPKIRFFTDYREDALDLHEKEFAVPVTVRHPLDGLYSIVDAFQLARMHWSANPADDALPVTLQSFGKLDQGRYVAFMRMAQPLLPG